MIVCHCQDYMHFGPGMITLASFCCTARMLLRSLLLPTSVQTTPASEYSRTSFSQVCTASKVSAAQQDTVVACFAAALIMPVRCLQVDLAAARFSASRLFQMQQGQTSHGAKPEVMVTMTNSQSVVLPA